MAKCGHVGNGKYYEVRFPIVANDKSEAAQKCLRRGKVKKHLKNAISGVQEITLDEYQLKMEEMKNNTYVRAHTKREITEYIQCAKVLPSTSRHHKNSFENRKERISFQMRKQRIMEEFAYA